MSDDLLKAQDAALRAQNNAPSWRDCNAAGLRHQWELSHTTGVASYWKCHRVSCAVDTRTTTGKPKGVL